MTFWRAYSGVEWSESANDATRDTKNYMPDNSYVIIIIINTQGQIVQSLFHKESLLT